MPDVTLSGLVKRFGALTAVDHIDLTVAEGEMVTLLGPSGCGKTTTLRMVAGLEVADAGSIRIGGATVFDRAAGIDVPSERRNLGMVFQSYAIWPHMTVFENVAYPLRMRRIPMAERRRRVGEVLVLVGLSGREDTPATNLSGGQQQRVALARALVFEPQVLLLDEPLSNLDAKLREHMRFELRVMQSRVGVTALYVTHDQEEALTLSDRIVVMNEGHIEQAGTPREIYEEPASRFVAEFIGKANFIPLAGEADSDGSSVRVRLATEDGALALVLPRTALRETASRKGNGDGAGARGACLFIRPEKVSIGARGGALDGDRLRLPARVAGRAYLGDRNEYLLAVGDGVELRVQAALGDDWAPGEAVDLSVGRSDVLVYP
jgi:iron(III) transport system ATP-binding protein